MAGELAAVVEGDGLAQLLRHRGKQPNEMLCHTLGGSIARPGRQDDPCSPLKHGQRDLTVFCKQDRVGFPMARGRALGRGGWPFSHGNTAFNEPCGAAAAAAAQPALALGARQIAAPAVVLGTGDLGVDEAVDALMADHLAASLAREPAGDLFG
jgi:hypothetical protein